MNRLARINAIPVCFLLASSLSGCGDSGRQVVTGRITLNGAPLTDAIVCFMPADGEGLPAFGQTDGDGNYVLTQSHEAAGVSIGDYAVRISTFREANLESDPPSPGTIERVPPRYNIRTELTAAVRQDDDVFNFILESGKRDSAARVK